MEKHRPCPPSWHCSRVIDSLGSGEHRRQRVLLSYELRSCVADGHDNGESAVEDGSDPRDEVEDARCECYGMSGLHHAGVHRHGAASLLVGMGVRAVCRGCRPVAEETVKNGGDWDAALAADMAVCRWFNGFGRSTTRCSRPTSSSTSLRGS
ncbi:hypothetical protein HU200_010647 [Digitaria exilis]|uniref:Uncharacterized protein n=1 Tax=Digitaria exilis TaxID=1010633 RepID=A0A835FJ87_9POAL|nr:hypothetical protein HU200_010647 [Digitaria exilis]